MPSSNRSTEVERIERYHAEPVKVELDNPLFVERSLFRD